MSIFTPNTDYFSNYYDKEKYLLAWRISISFSTIFLLLLGIQLFQQETAIIPVAITFIVSISSSIFLTLSTIEKNITIKVESNIEKIGLKTIVPLGLLTNELVSNSIQHAFLNKTTGQIKISIMNQDKNDFNLNYSDNGIWKAIEKNYSSFGIELIGILASQLDGDYTKYSSDKGTMYNFKLKNIDLNK